MTAIPVSERVNWVGASEVAAVFGVSKFKTRFQLWHEKKGNIPSVNLDRNLRVMAGRHFETGIAAFASDRWNWPIIKCRDYSPHERVPRFGASLDFMTVDGLEPVETKWVDWSIFKDEFEAEGEVIVDAPSDYICQVQAQLACRPKAQRGWLVTCVGGNRLYRMEVPRHAAFQTRIEEEVAEFWRSVELDQEPAPDYQADAATISLLYTGKGDEFADLRGNARANELATMYRTAHELEVAAKGKKKAALAELKRMMNDARNAVLDRHTIKASAIGESTIYREAHFRFNVRPTKE